MTVCVSSISWVREEGFTRLILRLALKNRLLALLCKGTNGQVTMAQSDVERYPELRTANEILILSLLPKKGSHDP